LLLQLIIYIHRHNLRTFCLFVIKGCEKYLLKFQLCFVNLFTTVCISYRIYSSIQKSNYCAVYFEVNNSWYFPFIWDCSFLILYMHGICAYLLYIGTHSWYLSFFILHSHGICRSLFYIFMAFVLLHFSPSWYFSCICPFMVFFLLHSIHMHGNILSFFTLLFRGTVFPYPRSSANLILIRPIFLHTLPSIHTNIQFSCIPFLLFTQTFNFPAYPSFYSHKHSIFLHTLPSIHTNIQFFCIPFLLFTETFNFPAYPSFYAQEHTN